MYNFILYIGYIRYCKFLFIGVWEILYVIFNYYFLSPADYLQVRLNILSFKRFVVSLVETT